MSKAEPDGSFWTSLGGILTGIAAIITAVGGLIGVWYQLDPARTPSPPLEAPPQPPSPDPSGSPVEPPGELPEALHASRPTSESSPTTTAANAPHAGKIQIGETVLAEWQSDGCLYPADVRQFKDGRYLVYFAFNEELWIAPEGLVTPVTPTASDVAPGARVYAMVEDARTRWIPSTVRRVRDRRYYVVFDENAECRPGDRGHVWADIDGIVVSD